MSEIYSCKIGSQLNHYLQEYFNNSVRRMSDECGVGRNTLTRLVQGKNQKCNVEDLVKISQRVAAIARERNIEGIDPRELIFFEGWETFEFETEDGKGKE